MTQSEALFMQSTIRQLLSGQSLIPAQVPAVLGAFLTANPLQQALILALLAAKGESFDEICAVRDYLLKQSTFNQALLSNAPIQSVDLVGTGGSGFARFNISTAASLVVASCGVDVAKHGGRSVSSCSGSADVMAALKIPIYQNSADIIQSLYSHHYTFVCASYFNPVLKALGSLRKTLGFPTVFNIVGPLLNPLRVKRQVIGVYRKDLLTRVAEVLKASGSVRALVVHSAEGLDELGLSGPNEVAELYRGEIKEYRICPKKLGFKSASVAAISGEDPALNARIIQGIFSGKIADAKRDIVVLNAAAGLLVADKVSTLLDGVEIAQEAISSGKTQVLVEKLQAGDH
ncbi:MAG: anthranilate phosphoribosyltransferase [Candidatus Aquirickettsiella gammari]|jgi:anthranilate phosphoribosyltransferase|uniref:Anthranilate phosphoribosyltransferase n=1 Tax=Candidatus Aquirickettsiella gammari TaxID=2016198 RepID=A0A370CLV2_9COXI|nr:MAG: anthranilate phosphoribosyltransferase [Candidatus Aquirickettsiella gammari]